MTMGVLLAAALFLSPFTGHMPACQHEDSTWCYWDASKYGNGTGDSFISTWEGGPLVYLG